MTTHPIPPDSLMPPSNRRPSWHPILAAALLALACSPGVRAETIHLYPPASIQTAIDQAADGDEIVVHPGTYPGLIDLRGKALTLRSSDGPELTTLDGLQAGTVVTCRTDETPDTVLDGFLITGGRSAYNGGGMMIQNADPTVRNCVFRDNQAQYGGGIFASSAQPVISNCLFEQNVATGSGGGLYCFGYPGETGPALADCRFEENYAESSGGGLRTWDVSPVLVRCVFHANVARYSGAGAANGGDSRPTYADCRFEHNRTDTLYGAWDCYGGGMSNFETSRPTLVNCVFASNSAISSYPRLSRGGALAGGGSARPMLINCTLLGNRADLGDGVACSADALTTVKNSILWNGGDEILLEIVATATISYSTVQGGYPGPGNLDDDPRLEDLRLQSDSPCIDAGDPTYDPPDARDADGHARVLCGRVDMGAYEFGIGDADCDRDVDSQDFVLGVECVTGPDNGPYAAGCAALDFEYDHDVDLADLAALQCLFGE